MLCWENPISEWGTRPLVQVEDDKEIWWISLQKPKTEIEKREPISMVVCRESRTADDFVCHDLTDLF